MGLFGSSDEPAFDWLCSNLDRYATDVSAGREPSFDPRACGSKRGVGTGDKPPRGRCNCGAEWIVTDYSKPENARWWHACDNPATPKCSREPVYVHAKPPAKCPHCKGKRRVVDHHGNDQKDRRRAALIRAAKAAPVKVVTIPVRALAWTGVNLLKVLGSAGRKLVVDPVSGKVKTSAMGQLSGSARAALAAKRCPACGKGLPRAGYFCGKCAAGAAIQLSGVDMSTLGNPHQDDQGRNRNGLRYRTEDNQYGLEGSRIFPHDGDW